MREIKFRALNENDILTAPFDWYDLKYAPVENFKELMQYTGLKDKNGKEIYEGDIMLYHSRNSRAHPTKLHKRVVGYHEERAAFGFRKMSRGNGDMIHVGFNNLSKCPQNSEVIGNIYENPELLV